MIIEIILDLKELVKAHKKYLEAITKFEKETDVRVCGVYKYIQLPGRTDFSSVETTIEEKETLTDTITEESFFIDGIKIIKVNKKEN